MSSMSSLKRRRSLILKYYVHSVEFRKMLDQKKLAQSIEFFFIYPVTIVNILTTRVPC